MEKSFDTILLLGLSHHNAVRGAAISAHGMFRTTLGNIGLNEDFVIRCMAKNGNVRHLPAAHDDEHSPQNLPRLSESFVQASGYSEFSSLEGLILGIMWLMRELSSQMAY